MQYSTNDAANSEQLHRCGLEINELARRLEIEIEHLDEHQILLISHNYGTVLQKYSINHATIDFDLTRIRKKQELKNKNIASDGLKQALFG
jgi:SMODS and SLOG-associating 2TM effector domain family 5